jgi:hypothetical protein
LKKRKVDKEKEKEKSEPELVVEIRGLREEFWELTSVSRAAFHLFKNLDANVAFITDQLDLKLNGKGAEEEDAKKAGKTPEEALEDASEEMPEGTLQ